MVTIFTSELITYISSILIGSGVLVYIAKRFIDKGMDLGSDYLKMDMQNKLELYKNELEKKNFEFQTKFSSLHKERVETIKSFYSKLQKFNSCLKSAFIHINTIPAPPLHDQVGIDLTTKLWDSYSELIDFYSDNRIFFSREIQEKMSWLSNYYVEHLLKNQNIQIWESTRSLYNHEDYDKFLEEKYGELIEFHNTYIPKILSELEDIFRKMLGVE